MIKKYNAQEIEARMALLGLTIPDFHLVGVRSHTSIPDKFDDSFYIMKDHNILGDAMWCTTNPGKDYLLAPMNPKGTFILAADKQYINCFKLGLHKGKEALIQCSTLLGYRDNDKDEIYEEAGDLITAPADCRVDIHRANDKWTSVLVGRWSAGCQVIANPIDFALLLKACKDTSKGFFTYTLLKEW